MRRFNGENGRKLTLAAGGVAMLKRYYWPGNVRELENCVRRTATLAHGEVITREDLSCAAGECLSATLWAGSGRGAFEDPIGELAKGKTIAAPILEPPVRPAPAEPLLPARLPDDAAAKACERAEGENCPALSARLTEKERLIDAMERAGWVQAKAARILDITPRQIGYALRKYRIEMKRF